MRDYRDSIPGYRTIRIGAPVGGEAAVADEQAWRARDAYPDWVDGGPVFGVARELEHGGWELGGHFGYSFPQDSRDSMGHRVRVLAAGYPEDSGEHAACMRAAERMDREAIDVMTVLGTRYRVVRADQFIRTGSLGPEPPRPSDPDPEPPEPGRARDLPDPAEGFVIDPATGTTISRGLLTMDLLQALPKPGTVPPEVGEDAMRAAHTHPGGVLLPVVFTIGRLTRGQWAPAGTPASPTPQAARDRLVRHLRISIPYHLDLSDEQRVKYNAAADRVEDDGVNEVAVAGQRFRIVRVERLVRIGPDGPEGPRPSDPDPQPPVLADGDGVPELEDDDDMADEPYEPSEEAKRFDRLFNEEQERIEAKRARSAGRAGKRAPRD